MIALVSYLLQAGESFVMKMNLPKSPFWGTKILLNISYVDVYEFIDLKHLFEAKWGYNKSHFMQAKDIFADIKEQNIKEQILKPMVVYGYFPCKAEDQSLIVYDNEKLSTKICSFKFPRLKNYCLSDFFSSQQIDLVGFFVVTVGDGVARYSQKLLAQNSYQRYLFWHGFAAAFTEALAEFVHQLMRVELGLEKDEKKKIEDILKHKYIGERFAFGYPACPNLEDQAKVLQILQADKIGVSLSETYHLIPEFSTLALVAHSKRARY